MKQVFSNHSAHLTYCLNIHRGETWCENFEAIRTSACEVRDRVCSAGRFGLGLRLSAQAAGQLLNPSECASFRDFLVSEDLYVFTVNGFPYGQFHGTVVKEDVYAPDWSTADRVTYTRQLAELLAVLVPEGVTGSISTVPGTYRAWTSPTREMTIIENLMGIVVYLAELENRTGRRLILALEPEPDCLWDTTEDIAALFGSRLPDAGYGLVASGLGCSSSRAEDAVRRHLGVCLDTCHQAVLFEDPAACLNTFLEAGICVAKIQVSAAPCTLCSSGALSRMRAFVDPCFLHQSAILRGAGTEVLRFPDLLPALSEAGKLDDSAELRTHFHIPLVVDRWGEMGSTVNLLDERFWARVRRGGTEHVEVETYTFDVLPPELRQCPVEESVANELSWVLDRLAATGASNQSLS